MGSVFFKLLSVFAEFYAKQVSEKSKATKQRMIKENKYTGGFRPKFGYDVFDLRQTLNSLLFYLFFRHRSVYF